MIRLRAKQRAGAALGLAVALACAIAPAHGQTWAFGRGPSAPVRVLSWRDIPFRTVVRQEHDYSCGSAALATLLTYHYGRPTSERETFTEMFAKGDQVRIRKVGFSMLDMKHYLAAHGLQADGYRLSLDELAQTDAPMIALINIGAYRHFVVIKGVDGERILIGDPALGLKIVPKAVFKTIWRGLVLIVHADPASARPRFNQASEWSPWASAPLRTAALPETLTSITSNLPPLYQITPVVTTDIPGG